MVTTYLSLKAYILSKIPTIKHVDFWNDQINNLDDENPFNKPAVFIEFSPISWANVNKTVKKAQLNITLHIVTDCYDSRADDTHAVEALNLMDDISHNLDGFKIANCTPFLPETTTSDNNHGNLIHNQLSYSTEMTKCITGGKNYVEVNPELQVEGEFLQNS